MSQTPCLVQYWGGCPQVPNSKWRRFLHLISSCAARGWRTCLVWSERPQDAQLVRPFEDAGCEIVLAPRPSGNFDLGCVRRTYRLVRRVNCDIFHCHNIHTSPLLGAALAGVPVRIWSKLSMSPYYEQGLRPRGLHRLSLSTRVSCALAHRILAISAAVREELLCDGAPPHKTVVVHEPIDYELYATASPDGVRAGLGLEESDFVVTTVGHAVPVKGWDILISAFATVSSRYPQARLLLVGSTGNGEEVETARTLQAQVARLGLGEKVVFAGQRRDVPQLLAASNLFVLPSRSEGLPFTLSEAMAAGLPCVATRTGGIPELITSGSDGLLFERESADQLAAALLNLCDKESLRQRLATAAQLSAARLSLAAADTVLMDLYLDLLTINRPGTAQPA